MAETAELTALELRAGREYLDALRSLKFEPDILCWVVENDGMDSGFGNLHNRLAIVTSLADRVGPTKIYDLLFEAYTLAVTPKEIDPFQVSVYSPHSRDGKYLIDTTHPNEIAKHLRESGDFKGPMWGIIMDVPHMNAAPWPQSVYAYNIRRRDMTADLRRFAIMRRTLDRIAA